jgi:hypothetical protein
MEQAGKRDVIIYGLGNTVWDMIDYIRMRFHIMGCSDSNTEKADTADKLGIPFVYPEKLCSLEYDYILITSVYDDEISRQLVETKGLPREKVLRRIQWCRMLFTYSFGSMNKDKTFYLFSHPIHLRDGLFSFLFAFLEQMDFVEKNDCIPVVDMQNFQNQYLDDDKIGVENAWEYYYAPLSEYSLAEVYQSKNVILGYDDNCYKGNYEQKYNIKQMSMLYQKYIRYNKETAEAARKAYRRNIDQTKKTLGVLFRGSDMSALKLKNHPVQPTIDEMISLIHKYMEEWECERIFLSTEDAGAARRLKAEFGEILSCTDQKRFADTGQTWLANINFEREHDRYLRGIEYLITIELLSRCDCLLAGICTGSICAQIMNNGKYEHVKMIDKGEYE